MAHRLGYSVGGTTSSTSVADQIKRYKLRDLPSPTKEEDAFDVKSLPEAFSAAAGAFAVAGAGAIAHGSGPEAHHQQHHHHHHLHHHHNPAKESLKDKCVRMIVRHFEARPVDEGSCPPELMRKITARLPLDLDPAIGALHVFDEAYWKRRCVARFGWSACDLLAHGQVWKQLFFETFASQVLEDFALPPGEVGHGSHGRGGTGKHHGKHHSHELHGVGRDPQHHSDGPAVSAGAGGDKVSLLANLAACQDYIFSLRIKELRSHLPLDELLPLLPNLTTLSATYGVRRGGMARLRLEYGLKEVDAQGLSRALADGPASCPSLTTLSLPANLIDDDMVRVLMEGLVRNDAITSLDLSRNKISNAGVRLLARLLGQHSVLTSLNLCDNSIRAEGGRYLARGLRHNDSLVELNLRLNRLGDQGGDMLLRGLLPSNSGSAANGGAASATAGVSGGGPSGMRSTSLSGPHSSTSGGGGGGYVAGGHSLARLNLASNGLGNLSARALADVLVAQGESAAFGPGAGFGGFGSSYGGNGYGGGGIGGGLQILDLNGNGLEGDDAALLAEALRSSGHPYLTSVDLRANPCSAAGNEDPVSADALDAIGSMTRANELSAR